MKDKIAEKILKMEKYKLMSKPESDRDWELITAIDLAIKALEERPQGEWIKGREISRTMLGDKVQHIDYKDYTCSNCGLVLDNLLYWYDGSPFYNFCPNCGADMRGGRE